MSTTAYNPTLHSLRVAALHCLTSRLLAEHGFVSIQDAVHAIGSGALSERPFFKWHASLFEGAAEGELAALYEPALNLLERDSGPLICDETRVVDGHKVCWGYSHHLTVPTRGGGEALSPVVNYNLWTEREDALDTGHPDATKWQGGSMPDTIWRRANSSNV